MLEKISIQDGLVSVIMPAYNSEKTIAESIESVLAQTYPNWELWIVDDGSTDNIEKVVSAYNDERIHYEKLEENQGVAHARNLAIRRGKGRYIAFLDSDDLWLPMKLEHQLYFMKKTGTGFSYTHYRSFRSNPQKIGKEIKTSSHPISYQDLLKGNEIGCLTVMIDRYQYPKIQMPSARHEDYITWLNLLREGGSASSLHEDLARYREDGEHALTSKKSRSLLWTWKVYRESQKQSLFMSTYYMIFYLLKGIKKHILYLR